jgi:hypothetical protein
MSYIPPVILAKKITLSANDIKALHTTPIELVAAPGASKLIFPTIVTLVLHNTSTAWTGGSKDVVVVYDTPFSNILAYPSLTQAFFAAPVGDSYYTQANGMNVVSYQLGGNWSFENLANKRLVLATIPTASAYLTGGSGAEDDYTVWAAISNGSFAATFNGMAFSITGIDFSLVGSMSDVQDVINTAISGKTGGLASGTWSTDHFVFTVNESTGFNNAITVFSSAGVGTDISGASYMDCAANGVVTPATYDPLLDGTGTLDVHINYTVISI